MLIQEAINQNCSCCGRFEKQIQPEKYGCDWCGKEIDDKALRVTRFYHNKEAEHSHFDKWACVFSYLKTHTTDYFIDLPFLSFSTAGERALTAEFLSHITVKKAPKKITPKRNKK